MSKQHRQPLNVDVSNLWNKLPPKDEAAEAACLGSMLLDWRRTGDVIEHIQSSEDFHKPAHAAIYETLLLLYNEGYAYDVVTLQSRLTNRGQLERVGGVKYLIELAEAVPHSSGAAHYAEIVARKAKLRRMADITGKALYDCYHRQDETDAVIDETEQAIFALRSQYANERGHSDLGSLLQETFHQIEENDGRLVTGLETSFFEFDEMTSGLQPGEMIVIAARPSIGKTALALSMMQHIGLVQQQGVAMFSLEMSRPQLAMRLLSAHSGVSSHQIRRNMLGQPEFAALSASVSQLSDAPIHLLEVPALTPTVLRSEARRMRRSHDIEAVFIDYLQLMTATEGDSRQEQVTQLSRSVKAVARELNIPVVCLSQLNRQPANREDHRPRLADLRESGSIEQDADVVAFLHREDPYHSHESADEYRNDNSGELITAKQRNGPCGSVSLHFNPETMSFGNRASHPSA